MNTNKPISTWGWCASPWEGESLVCSPVQPSARGKNRAQSLCWATGAGKYNQYIKPAASKEWNVRNISFINTICSKCEIIEKQITGELLQLPHELPRWKKGWKDGPWWGSLVWIEGRVRGPPELSGRFSIRLSPQPALWAEFHLSELLVTVTSLIDEIQEM